MHIPLWVNIVVQVAAFGSTTFFAPGLIDNPVTIKWAQAIISFLQGTVSLIAHFSTPQGTSQAKVGEIQKGKE